MTEKSAIVILSNIFSDKDLQNYTEANSALSYLSYAAPSQEGIECLVQLMNYDGQINFKYSKHLSKQISPEDDLRMLAMQALARFDRKRFLEEAAKVKINFRKRKVRELLKNLVEECQ